MKVKVEKPCYKPAVFETTQEIYSQKTQELDGVSPLAQTPASIAKL